MKKVFSLILALAVFLLLVGCAGTTVKVELPEAPFAVTDLTPSAEWSENGKDNIYTITSFEYAISQENPDGTCDVKLTLAYEHTWNARNNFSSNFNFYFNLYDSEGYAVSKGQHKNSIKTYEGDKVKTELTFKGLDPNETYRLEIIDHYYYE
ncbi:MAG: hypothetical protein IKA51_04000 [Clostridia bacterium]|nr:hypothetical protein [Clostridia bacterium]